MAMTLGTPRRPEPAVLPRTGVGNGLLVRPSTAEDVPAMTAIYARHLAAGIASFEDVTPTVAVMAARREAVLAQGLPHLVAVDATGAVVGWCWAMPFRLRAAYRATVEDSVYVREDLTGRGVGRQLLLALIDACDAQGLAQMVAVVGDARNTASIRLHESLGFVPVALFQGIGFRPDGWVDTVMLQRPLRAAGARPPARLS